MVASFLLGLIFYTYLFKYIYLLIRGFLRWLLGFVHEWRQKPQVLHHQHLWINRSQNSWHSLPFANSIFAPNKINIFFLVDSCFEQPEFESRRLDRAAPFLSCIQFSERNDHVINHHTSSTVTLAPVPAFLAWNGMEGRRAERNEIRRKQRMVNGEVAGKNLEVFSDRKVVQEHFQCILTFVR